MAGPTSNAMRRTKCKTDLLVNFLWHITPWDNNSPVSASAHGQLIIVDQFCFCCSKKCKIQLQISGSYATLPDFGRFRKSLVANSFSLGILLGWVGPRLIYPSNHLTRFAAVHWWRCVVVIAAATRTDHEESIDHDYLWLYLGNQSIALCLSREETRSLRHT